jgi:hypothetical protein
MTRRGAPGTPPKRRTRRYQGRTSIEKKRRNVARGRAHSWSYGMWKSTASVTMQFVPSTESQGSLSTATGLSIITMVVC